MGVPKFYRWTSERYPCLSEVVKEYQIPEFDNLYLDMNGIIHVCSHPDDSDPHFRISEDKIFKDIFHYIEVLFRLIQPKKVFFMAVDGVAPRAKMNQQRARRFRSAMDAHKNEQKARERGEVLPSEERFDSNCITPGTDFMTRLDSVLQYFVTSKITNDRLWQNCQVIYSGHKVPGEGEHKIMEYIRYSKSQPDYPPNTRHCLYGLDADLIMLGLTSHEPYFCLLREEVRFGGRKESTKRTPTIEETTFHLLHLGLMREYINYEFSDLRGKLAYGYNLESIIDDWVLMGYLVGNDFIPHLPNLHIHEGALPVLYRTYKSVMPSLDGYLNEGGTLNLKRFEAFMQKLTEFETETFQELNDNIKYLAGKSFKRNAEGLEPFDFGNDCNGLDDRELTVSEIKSTLSRLGLTQDAVLEDLSSSESDSEETIIDAEFQQHKRNYYMEKMDYKEVNSDVLREQATNYIQGLQWILHYYYNGICSWSWFYPHNYAPYISDVKNFADMDMEFEKKEPFLPFEQLLAVLPPLSAKLLPPAYRYLMLDEISPLKEYYPVEFKTDLNGKQQDWEAVVLIPFIDESKLLHYMEPCNKMLTEEEKSRNSHGPMHIFMYTPNNLGEYKGLCNFPSMFVNYASVKHVHRREWEIPKEKILKGILPKFNEKQYYIGFSTLKHLKHTFYVAQEGIKVFQQKARGENFILKITPEEIPCVSEVARMWLGKSVFVSWPHLTEAKVTAVASRKVKYTLKSDCKEFDMSYLEGSDEEFWRKDVLSIAARYHERWGVDIGETHLLIYGFPLTGRTYAPSQDGTMKLEKQWSRTLLPYAWQTVVQQLPLYAGGYRKYISVADHFPAGTKVFMLGQPYYGCMGEVLQIDPSHKGRIRISMITYVEPNFEAIKRMVENDPERYYLAKHACQKAGLSSHLLAAITGTSFLASSADVQGFTLSKSTRNKLNFGLGLRNNKKNEEVVGFTKKVDGVWYYTDQCIELVREYQAKFSEIFEYLGMHGGHENIYTQEEIFGQNCKAKVAELTVWLKDNKGAQAERQPVGTKTLGEHVVNRIMEEVDKIKAIRARHVKMQVRPLLLFKPNPIQGITPPDSSVTFLLYDRVINVREGYSVPLGLRGTVIGISSSEHQEDVVYSVLFDSEFAGGLSLGYANAENRCYRVHWAALINISHGCRVSELSHSSHDLRPLSGDHCTDMDDGIKHVDWEPKNPFSSRNVNFSESGGWRQGFGHVNIMPHSPSVPVSQNKVQQVTHPQELEHVIHGTYFSNWESIKSRGLSTGNKNHIPCVSYIPSACGTRPYQLHIHLDLKKMLDDEIRVIVLPEGRVLVSGNRNGVLPTYYFKKVVDTVSNTVIYPWQSTQTQVFPLPADMTHPSIKLPMFSSPPKNMNMPAYQNVNPQLFQNIWSQVQNADQSWAPSLMYEPCTEQKGTDIAKVHVSVDDLFRRARMAESRGNSLVTEARQVDQLSSNSAACPFLPTSSPFIPIQVIRKQAPGARSLTARLPQDQNCRTGGDQQPSSAASDTSEHHEILKRSASSVNTCLPSFVPQTCSGADVGPSVQSLVRKSFYSTSSGRPRKNRLAVNFGGRDGGE